MFLSSTWLSITFIPELESPLLPVRPLHLNVTTTLGGVVLTASVRTYAIARVWARLTNLASGYRHMGSPEPEQPHVNADGGRM